MVKHRLHISVLIFVFISILPFWFVNNASAQGYAIQFSGNLAEHVQAEDSPSLDIDGKALTLEACVYPTGQGQLIIIVNKERSYEMALDFGVLRYAVNAPSWTWAGAGKVEVSEWSHLAVTYDGTETIGWINGKEVNSTKINSTNIVPSNEPFNIGWRPLGEHSPFIGIIDEVRISKTVRHTEDFDVPILTFEPDKDTVALYHLDEGEGKATEDASGNGNDAELIGDPKWIKSTVPLAKAVNSGEKLAIMWGAVKAVNSSKR